MKRIIVLGIILFLLTGCFYAKEAKQLKKDKDVQERMEKEIVKQGKEHFGFDLQVDMSKLTFGFPRGEKLLLPLKTDKELKVPVQTIGEPGYEFTAYMNIYNDEKQQYEFDENKVDLSELPKIGTFLLTKIYKELHKDALQEIKEFDEGITMKVELEDTFSGYYFEDEQEEKELVKAFASDYNSGKFLDKTQYETLIKKHAAPPNDASNFYERQIKGSSPCTAEITLNIDHKKSHPKSQTERMERIVDFIEQEETLPNGLYSIFIREDEPEDTTDVENNHEMLLICK